MQVIIHGPLIYIELFFKRNIAMYLHCRKLEGTKHKTTSEVSHNAITQRLKTGCNLLVFLITCKYNYIAITFSILVFIFI